MASANEKLVALVNRGYAALGAIREDYGSKKKSGHYNKDTDIAQYERQMNKWATEVVEELRQIFPTELESNLFLNPEVPLGTVNGDYEYENLVFRFAYFVRGLETIRQNSLPQYTDLPLRERLYVEDIDSFQKVRDVNPAMVTSFLAKGFLDRTEDQIQIALEQILDVSFHKEGLGRRGQ